MSIAIHVHERDRKVFASLVESGKQSLRKIAQITGFSKDSVARSMASILERDKYPESHLWETKDGQEWLRLMMVAMLYEFGLKGNQGAERMSLFLKRIHVDTHVGVSPTTLRTMMRTMEESLADFQQQQEQEQRGKEVRKIVAAGDETWLGEEMLLILMDLGSGYLVMEEAAEDRSYETWKNKSQARLDAMGVEVKHFISDRAKALIKLATSGFGSLAGADIFHAQYDISKWLGRSLYGKKGRASTQLKEAEEKKAKLEEKGVDLEEAEEKIAKCQEKLKRIEAGKEEYAKTQQAVSTAVHAFSVTDNTPQTSKQVEDRLEEYAEQFVQIAQAQSTADNKDASGKFRRQIEDISSIVDAWWQWAGESLTSLKPTAKITQWLLYILLPVIYWHHQMQKTQHREIKKVYETAWQNALSAYLTHPITEILSQKELDYWLSWADWNSSNFHRASSAVEGRNGMLTQSYRNGRRLSSRRLSALTAIHNYDTRRHDGSTPAERLYGQQFPDLFGSLLGQIEALPLPRKSRRRVAPNPFAVSNVAG